MEGGLSGNTVLTNSNDKLKVLNVKPLRILVPQFPDSSYGHPFVCVPPNGPFPARFSPFFPFSVPSVSESAPDLSRNGINSTAMLIRELIENVLLRFDALRRKLSQIEDTMELPSGVIKRADLKSGNTMMSKGSMGGIDYMKGDLEGELVALSIVSYGGYDNDAEDPDILIYSGQGGTAGRDKEASDQKLERGNLALEKSLHRGNEIRVIRGLNDTINQSSKVYVYDGLYKIQESWMEKGKSGCNMFKYKLARIPGQTGAESIPVSPVNEVDDDNGPAYFTYFPTVKYLRSFNSVHSTLRCDCREAFQPGNANYSCIQKNGGDFPCTTNGVLVCRKPLIYECGPSCPCGRNCKNRVSQTGLKLHLEVFRTRERGWGLRSVDSIRAGSFICEYAGEVIDNKASQAGGYGGIDDYIFYTNRHYESFKWSYEPDLVGEESSDATVSEPSFGWAPESGFNLEKCGLESPPIIYLKINRLIGYPISYLICVLPEICRARESVTVKEGLAPLNRPFGTT
ncbi:Histone-lysine N-methyltransferase, H3 lysine-9 specific SUVH1 [Hibiscus syriacus]|uniref:Histone-lysine N-methyltransferase, H3 lysine-9 specific SUVH1 n=1 Tax=Hibiscus syriacus TaxID=106335 RepID=A0A6A2X4D2_HIBSY|nr:Histone-lysine N-methyltransferase, H3 lysine-9 specific SUVH1 [Hibiscus syriacus]